MVQTLMIIFIRKYWPNVLKLSSNGLKLKTSDKSGRIFKNRPGNLQSSASERELDSKLNAASWPRYGQSAKTRARNYRVDIAKVITIKGIKDIRLKAKLSFFPEAEALSHREISSGQDRASDDRNGAVPKSCIWRSGESVRIKPLAIIPDIEIVI